jgi:hypothetical protein
MFRPFSGSFPDKARRAPFSRRFPVDPWFFRPFRDFSKRRTEKAEDKTAEDKKKIPPLFFAGDLLKGLFRALRRFLPERFFIKSSGR